jgi:hypothetical protein
MNARAYAVRISIAVAVILGSGSFVAVGSNGVAGAASNTKPRVVITSTSVVLSGKTQLAPVTLSCSGAACSGSIQMTGTVKIKKRVGKRTVTKATSVVLASTPYKLAKGKSGTFNLTPTKTGRSSLAKANASSPLRATLIASVKGGSTSRKAVVVGGRQFVGTYALTVAPNFCGPNGSKTGSVMYVQGTAVTDIDPADPADPAGPFTGTASAQGTGYHLVLVQSANEIMDDIMITLSNGGNDITGTGQLNLEASGGLHGCPISFTGLRTSASVPTLAPTTTTTAPPPTTTTTAPPATTTTTAPPATSATTTCPTSAQAMTAWTANSGTNQVAPGTVVSNIANISCWKNWVLGFAVSSSGNGSFVFSQTGGLHSLTPPESSQLNSEVCSDPTSPSGWRGELGC